MFAGLREHTLRSNLGIIFNKHKKEKVYHDNL